MMEAVIKIAMKIHSFVINIKADGRKERLCGEGGWITIKFWLEKSEDWVILFHTFEVVGKIVKLGIEKWVGMKVNRIRRNRKVRPRCKGLNLWN